ncbi:hypothetical protein TSOC_002043, partial [Tetrabaena socialis]
GGGAGRGGRGSGGGGSGGGGRSVGDVGALDSVGRCGDAAAIEPPTARWRLAAEGSGGALQSGGCLAAASRSRSQRPAFPSARPRAAPPQRAEQPGGAAVGGGEAAGGAERAGRGAGRG